MPDAAVAAFAREAMGMGPDSFEAIGTTARLKPTGGWRGPILALVAALVTGGTATAADPAKPAGAAAAGTTQPAATADQAPAFRVERHSPREGHPSLGPAGARSTLIFFTDYQ